MIPGVNFLDILFSCRIIGRCRRCAKLDNDARLRQDFSKFRDMLLSLRRQEEEYNDGSKIAFIIQVD